MNPRQYGPQILPPASESTRILKERLNAAPTDRRQEEGHRTDDGADPDRREVRPH